jgi:hypothetical protein
MQRWSTGASSQPSGSNDSSQSKTVDYVSCFARRAQQRTPRCQCGPALVLDVPERKRRETQAEIMDKACMKSIISAWVLRP